MTFESCISLALSLSMYTQRKNVCINFNEMSAYIFKMCTVQSNGIEWLLVPLLLLLMIMMIIIILLTSISFIPPWQANASNISGGMKFRMVNLVENIFALQHLRAFAS